jgi:hypothetical protein
MTETPAPFDPGEFHRRCAVLQAAMACDGLAALLLSAPADIAWITGLATRFWQSPCRAWFVVVPARSDPVAVIPEIGCAPMARTWLDDIRSYPSPHPDDDGLSPVWSRRVGACVSDDRASGCRWARAPHRRCRLPAGCGYETALRADLTGCGFDRRDRSMVAGARAW